MLSFISCWSTQVENGVPISDWPAFARTLKTRLEEEDFLFLNAEEEDVLETNDFMVVVEAIISISGDAVQERTEKRGMWETLFRRQWWWYDDDDENDADLYT